MRPRLAAALSVLFFWATTSQAAPVTGWLVVNPQGGGSTTKPITGASTDSPVLGNGSEDSAAMVAMYADISGLRDAAPDIALLNGQKVTLTGTATMQGIVSSMEQFRWGLFNESGSPFDASGWIGFIASNSAGSGGGALRAKPSESGSFAQTGSAVNLRTAQDGDDFIDETYSFSMSVSRFNNEVSIDASLTSADDWTQIWKDVIYVPPSSHWFNFNRVGFLAGSGMSANRITFSNIDVTKQSIDALTLQVIATGPYAGAVQIRNNRPEEFEVEYYEITSAAGSLSTANWTSLDDQEGGDPRLQGWDEAAGNGTKLLSEYRMFSTTTVDALSSLSLGQAFNVGGAQDLKFFIGLADGTFARGIVEYVAGPALAGDYNNDGQVDAADYVAWQKSEGTNNLLPNDPTGGQIGMAQYNYWRSNFGQSAGGGGAAPVPEPGVVVILLTGLFAVCFFRHTII